MSGNLPCFPQLNLPPPYEAWQLATPIWFDNRYSVTNLAYNLPLNSDINLATDTILTASVAVAPSGAGEMEVSTFTVSGTTLTVTPTGGQPGRTYEYQFTVTLTSGAVYSYVVYQNVQRVQITDVPQVPPDPGFGMPVTWTYSPYTMDGLLIELPANAVIRAIYIQNTTANAITGGINLGSTSGGDDLIAALAIGPNALVPIPIGALNIAWFSATEPQSIYISAVSSWNGTALNIRVEYDV